MKKRIVILIFVFLLTTTPVAFADFVPNDNFYHNQWYFSRIGAEKAWEKINSSPDITIAVIDSGIDIDHPDLRQNIWVNNKEIPNNNIDDDHNGFVDDANGWDFIDNQPDPTPKFSSGWTESGVSHGTMIAGIISARGNNGKGVAGITWSSKIMPLKILNDHGEGRLNDVVRAVDYAVNNGADIINLSFTGYGYSESLQEALGRAYQKGVIVVAAAGNEQSTGLAINTDKKLIFPACYKGKNGEDLVIGVASTDALDQKTNFSGFGTHCIDLTAPGISFFSTIPKGSNLKDKNKEYDGYWSGTSMSAAVVSGAMALVLQTNPELSSRQAIDIVLGTCDNISQLNPNYLGQLGYGRVNVNAAVSFAQELLFEYSNLIIAAPASAVSGQSQPKVKILNSVGNIVKEMDPFPGYRGEIKVAAGNLYGDDNQELVFGASGNQIKVFSYDGKLKIKFSPFDKSYRGNVSLAVADVDSDGLEEIIAAPTEQNQPIKIFTASGKVKNQFFPFGKNFRSGINIVTSDFKGDSLIEIIASPANSKEKVKVFSSNGILLKSFDPYASGFKGGIGVAAVKISGRAEKGRADLAFVPASGMEALIRIYDSSLSLKRQFIAFDHNQKRGANLAAADFNNDGLSEIVSSQSAGNMGELKIWGSDGTELNSFPVFPLFKGGVNVGVIKIKN